MYLGVHVYMCVTECMYECIGVCVCVCVRACTCMHACVLQRKVFLLLVLVLRAFFSPVCLSCLRYPSCHTFCLEGWPLEKSEDRHSDCSLYQRSIGLYITEEEAHGTVICPSVPMLTCSVISCTVKWWISVILFVLLM